MKLKKLNCENILNVKKSMSMNKFLKYTMERETLGGTNLTKNKTIAITLSRSPQTGCVENINSKGYILGGTA